MFSSNEISAWVDEDDDEVSQTALCPKCGVDSVIVWQPGIDAAFLTEMHAHWFLK